MEDLTNAITNAREAVVCDSSGGNERATLLINLGNILFAEYQISKSPRSIDEAIANVRDGVKFTTSDPSRRVGSLYNLLVLLMVKVNISNDLELVQEGIDVAREIIDTRDANNHYRGPVHADLLMLYIMKFQRTTGQPDLMEMDRAIAIGRRLVQLAPTTLPSRRIWCNCLSLALGNRYDVTWKLEDIEESIRWAWEAVGNSNNAEMDRENQAGYLYTQD